MEFIYGLFMVVGIVVYFQDFCYWVMKILDIFFVFFISLYFNFCYDFLMFQGQGVEKLKQVLLFNNIGQQFEVYVFEVGCYFNFIYL